MKVIHTTKPVKTIVERRRSQIAYHEKVYGDRYFSCLISFIMNRFLLDKKIKKEKIFVILMTFAVLLPIVTAKLSGGSYSMTMHDNDHALMEREILKLIPIGSSEKYAMRVMKRNRFSCSIQTNAILECERDDGQWPTYEGTAWTAEIDLKNGVVTGVKVWIEPAD